MISEDDMFEYLTFGGTFRRAFGLLFERLDVFMGISLVFFIPYAILFVTFLAGVVTGAPGFDEYDGLDEGSPKLLIMTALDLLLFELSCVIGHGALSIAVAEIYVGRRPEWGSCLKRAWAVKWSLVCSSFLVHSPIFLMIAIPMVLLLFFILSTFSGASILFMGFLEVVFVYGAIVWYSGLILSSPAIVVEHFSNPIKGIKRSWELSTGSRCYVVSTMIAAMVGMWLLSSIFQAMLGDFIGLIIALMCRLIYLPLKAILETVLYLNLRIGRESMNQQVLMGDLMNSEPQSARFRNDDPAADGYVSPESLDYRHVPLMDEEEVKFSQPESMPNGTQLA